MFATVYDKKLRPLKVQDPEQALIDKGEVKEIQTDTMEELETVAPNNGNRETREVTKTPVLSIVATQPHKEGIDDKGVTVSILLHFSSNGLTQWYRSLQCL